MARPSEILSAQPSYDPSDQRQRIERLYVENYSLKSAKACKANTDAIVRRILAASAPRVLLPIFKRKLEGLIDDIFIEDHLYMQSLDDDLSGIAGLSVQRQKYHLASAELKYLTVRERVTAIGDTIVELFVAFFRHAAPAIIFDGIKGEPDSMVPLIALAREPKVVIQQILRDFQTLNVHENPALPALRDILSRNVHDASDIRPEQVGPNTRYLMPIENDAPLDRQVETYLRDTPFHDFLLTSTPFLPPPEARFEGMWILAPSGSGKTTLLHSMVLNDLEENATVILMDSKGELIEPFRKLAAIKDRLVLIDPDPIHPIAINPLDIPRDNIDVALDQLEYVFSSLLKNEMTSYQSILFRNVFRLLAIVPGANLDTFRKLLQSGPEPYADYIRKLPERTQDFFFTEFNTKLYDDRRKEVVGRLRSLLDRSETMGAMLDAKETRFKIGEAMDAGKVIIINNAKSRLGDDGAEFFGRFFIAQILAAAQQRAGRSHKKPVYLYIDECQTVIRRDERLPTILDECRSQKIALVLAHQRLEQIESQNVRSALLNCRIRYANTDDDSRAVASSMHTSQEALQHLHVGQFIAYVRRFTEEGVRVQVPFRTFSHSDFMSADEERQLRMRMEEQYGIPPKEPTPAPQEAPEVIVTPPTPPPSAPQSKETKAAAPKGTFSGSTEGSPSWGTKS